MKKESKVKYIRNNINKYVKIVFTISLFSLAWCSLVLGIGLQTSFVGVTLDNLKISRTYNIETITQVPVEYTNPGGQPVDIIIEPYTDTPDAGFEKIPDLSWVQITPNTLTLAGHETKKVDLTISIPNDITYLGKAYQVHIWGHGDPANTTQGVIAGVSSKVKFTISPQAIIYGGADYPAINKIEFLGNKLIVKTKISSKEASTVNLYYKTQGTTNYTKISAKKVEPVAGDSLSKNYYFEIPASAITIDGLEYYIESKTGTDYTSYPESTSLTTFVGTPYQVEVTQTKTALISTTGSTITVADGNPEDGTITLTAPKGAVGANTTITITQKDVNNTHTAPGFALSDTPAIIFDFGPSGTVFNKPVTLTLLYFDLDNDGFVDGLSDADGNPVPEDSLKICWWDGFDWRLVGKCTVDTAFNTVTAKIDHFSEYALFPAPNLAPSDYRTQERIITPNGDGKNDVADFNGLAEEIKIYDITGRKIRTVAAGTSNWDGKDDDSNIVESGIYIYQFKVDGTLISGVIAVAK